MAPPTLLEGKMELKAKDTYRCPQFDLFEGQTTEGFEVSDEQKAQMVADFPELFEVVGGTVKQVVKETATAEGSETEEITPVKKGKK